MRGAAGLLATRRALPVEREWKTSSRQSLFGSRRGAFTGAAKDRRGLIRSSAYGTLFLDEVGDLSLRAQPTLWRVLQGARCSPLGMTRAIPVDLRLISATHRDLDALVDK
jgi:two-component system response regulator GlrR